MEISHQECILDLSSVRYTGEEDITTFYVKFRQDVYHHLKKKGDKIDFLDNQELLEDEMLSPTFEEMIILWCLEKVDPRLPDKIKHNFHEQLEVGATLKGLESAIFNNYLSSYTVKLDKFDNEGDVNVKEERREGAEDQGSGSRSRDELFKEENALEVELDLGELTQVQDDGVEKFHTEEELGEHVHDMDDNPNRCNICRKVFLTKRSFNEHQLTHQEGHNKCEFCEKAFKNKEYLSRHVRKVHFKTGIRCNLCTCETIFYTPSSFDEHARTVHPGRKFSGPFKKKSNTQVKDQLNGSVVAELNSVLKQEKMVELDLDVIEGEILSDEDITEEALANSLNESSSLDQDSSSNVPCTICGKFYRSEKLLKFHMKHHKIDPKTCNVCGKKFMTAKRFYAHKGTHKIEHARCQFCSKLFKNKDYMKIHMRKKHFVNGVKCSKCPSGPYYYNASSYEEHVKSAHPEEQVFGVLHPLEVKLAAKSNRKFGMKCYHCKVMFYSEEKHEEHMKEVHANQNYISYETSKMELKDVDKIDSEDANDGTVSSIKAEGADRDVKSKQAKEEASKPQEDVPVKCKECDKVFKSEKHLSFHMRNHKIEYFKCEVCNKEFNIRRKYNDHKHIHLVEPCTCTFCGKSFQNKTRLQGHLKKHKSAPSKCDFCDTMCDNKEYLRIHKYYQHYMKGLRCDTCNVRLNNQTLHEEHLKNFHSDGVIPKYDQDEEAIPNTGNEMKDMKATKSEGMKPDFGENGMAADRQNYLKRRAKTVPCEMCGALLKGQSALRLHLLLTHDQKITCDKCGEEFGSMRLYHIHRRNVHNIVKTQGKEHCDVCGKFVSSMKAHNKTHCGENGEDGLMLQCETCRRKFRSVEQLGSHVCKHYNCEECDKKFIWNKNLRNHRLEHQGVAMHHCDQCECMFKSMKNLGTHKRVVHQDMRKYACTLCDKKFHNSINLRHHMNKHAGIKPFKCEDCGTFFRQKSGLIAHSKLHTEEFAAECDVCHQKFRAMGNLKKHKESNMCGFADRDLFKNSLSVNVLQ